MPDESAKPIVGDVPKEYDLGEPKFLNSPVVDVVPQDTNLGTPAPTEEWRQPVEEPVASGGWWNVPDETPPDSGWGSYQPVGAKPIAKIENVSAFSFKLPLIVTCAGCGAKYRGESGPKKFRCVKCSNLFTFPDQPKTSTAGRILCSNCWTENVPSENLKICCFCGQRVSPRLNGLALVDTQVKRKPTTVVPYTPQPSAKFEKVWIIRNDLEGYSRKGMFIHAHFSLSGMKDRQAHVVANFELANGLPLKDTNKKYCALDGQVCVFEDINEIPYDQTIWTDYLLFIPNDELHLNSGHKTDCRFRVNIYQKDSNSNFTYLTKSDYVYFSFQGITVVDEIRDTGNQTVVEQGIRENGNQIIVEQGIDLDSWA